MPCPACMSRISCATTTGGIDSEIPFVVRNDSSHSAIVYQTSDETWQAYNAYGGNSLYTARPLCPPGNPQGYQGAFAVSYNRRSTPPSVRRRRGMRSSR